MSRVFTVVAKELAPSIFLLIFLFSLTTDETSDLAPDFYELYGLIGLWYDFEVLDSISRVLLVSGLDLTDE